MIPKILHRCVPAEVPEEFEAFWNQWCALHPASAGWEHRTYRDPIEAAEWPALGSLHASGLAGAQLAGLIRLEAIATVGGVYVDMDMEPLRPIDELLVHPCFGGTEDGRVLTDAMFGALPGHPGVVECVRRVSGMNMKEGPWATGPGVTTEVLTGRPDVTILEVGRLYPYHYTERHRRWENFAATAPEAFAVHHWNASWLHAHV